MEVLFYRCASQDAQCSLLNATALGQEGRPALRRFNENLETRRISISNQQYPGGKEERFLGAIICGVGY